MPSTIVVAAVVAAVVFGVLVPMALRSIREQGSRPTTWAMTLSVVAFLTLAVFWSGIPLIIGTAAAWVAWEGRATALQVAVRPKPYTIALVLGGIAAVLPVLWTVVNNEVAW